MTWFYFQKASPEAELSQNHFRILKTLQFPWVETKSELETETESTIRLQTAGTETNNRIRLDWDSISSVLFTTKDIHKGMAGSWAQLIEL